MRHYTQVLTTLSLFAGIAFTGCKTTTNHAAGYQSSKERTPDQAVTQYKQTLAQSCGAKHLDAMSQGDLNTQTRLWYSKLDAPARDQYDKAIAASCKADSTQPDCYNAGILVGAVQDGTLDKFVTQVCAPQ